jgi:stalled ribosome rescue protein Dom34
MTKHFHAVTWIDHREARVLHFNAGDVDEKIVRAHNPAKQVHHKANSTGSGHAAEDRDFLHRAAEAMAGAHAVLITGPANTKNQLVKHIAQHDPKFDAVIAGVETLDHPTDGELLDFARRYFQKRDRMSPQSKRENS